MIEAVQKSSASLPAALHPTAAFLNLLVVLGRWADAVQYGVSEGEEQLLPVLGLDGGQPTPLKALDPILGRWGVVGIIGLSYLPQNAAALRSEYDLRWQKTIAPSAPLETIVAAFNASQQGYYNPVFMAASEIARSLGFTKERFESAVIAAAEALAPEFERIAQEMHSQMAKNNPPSPEGMVNNPVVVSEAAPNTETAPALKLVEVGNEDGKVGN